jgi:hypothetical protein
MHKNDTKCKQNTKQMVYKQTWSIKNYRYVWDVSGVLNDTCMLTMIRTWDLSRLAWFKYSYSRDMRFSTYDLSSIYLIFVLALTLTTQDAYDRGNESSKLISTIIFGRFIKLAITASLCEGPFFNFYVESSSSTFMYQLREHSCHSEYNVHSPKIYYWLIHDYGIACSQIICI